MLPQWENLPAGLGLGLSWNLLWTWSKPRINHSHLLIWQKVNHFEESRQLTRKDFLKKNLQRYTDMPHSLAKEFEIMPLTFLLPHEYNAFVSAFTSLESQKIAQQQQQQQQLQQHGNTADPTPPAPVTVTLNYWILKPVGLSRGRGISLIRDLGDLTYAQASVIQKYVENPLCLQQYKFDLRIYVVVTSFKPLEAFIYREGFARVSLEAYSTQPQDMDNLFIHLTNSSIQKKHISGPSKDNPVQTGHDSGADAEVGGSKISLLGQHGLWKRLELYSQGRIQSEDVWQAICTLIVKSLVVVDDKIPHQPNCFELFGYDVLIDSNLRPWLIEVNASPSLARENALDHRVKNALIRDIIELLDVAPFDRAALARVMRRRLNNIAKQRHVHGRNDAELEQDLQDILGDYRPRRHGEMPATMGQFERLAPDTPHFEKVLKLKKKLFKDA
jgi:tubulin polyglutamylase TTLL5